MKKSCIEPKRLAMRSFENQETPLWSKSRKAMTICEYFSEARAERSSLLAGSQNFAARTGTLLL